MKSYFLKNKVILSRLLRLKNSPNYCVMLCCWRPNQLTLRHYGNKPTGCDWKNPVALMSKFLLDVPFSTMSRLDCLKCCLPNTPELWLS